MDKKLRSSEPPFPLTSLPEEIIVDILAHVPRWEYPILSLVSKQFRSLVASSEIWARRSLIGCTQHCLYVILYNEATDKNRLYILHSHLVLIPWLPAMPKGASFAGLGSKIYMFYGRGIQHMGALSIDCVTHTVQTLPSMPIAMINTDVIADAINGKIYLIGYYELKIVIVVFNTETQNWEMEMIKPNMGIGHVVIMRDKMYTRGAQDSFVYDLKKNKWGKEEVLNLMQWRNACVVDDVLYYFDNSRKRLFAYDPKKRCWRVLNGLKTILDMQIGSQLVDSVSCGGKVVLFFSKVKEETARRSPEEIVWRAEISLRRSQAGSIGNKVEMFDQVITGDTLYFTKSIVVVV